MIHHVWERAVLALSTDAVAVATDDLRVARVVESFGGRAILTPSSCASGGDRVAAAMKVLMSEGERIDVIVNVQGDEPLLEPEAVLQVSSLVSPIAEGGLAPMATLARDLEQEEAEISSVVKVVCDLKGYALYFSRSPIGFDRGSEDRVLARAHVGLYAYTPSFLERLANLRPTPLEMAEQLEQLRILEHGLPIAVGHTGWRAISVDTPEDLERVRALAC